MPWRRISDARKSWRRRAREALLGGGMESPSSQGTGRKPLCAICLRDQSHPRATLHGSSLRLLRSCPSPPVEGAPATARRVEGTKALCWEPALKSLGSEVKRMCLNLCSNTFLQVQVPEPQNSHLKTGIMIGRRV